MFLCFPHIAGFANVFPIIAKTGLKTEKIADVVPGCLVEVFGTTDHYKLYVVFQISDAASPKVIIRCYPVFGTEANPKFFDRWESHFGISAISRVCLFLFFSHVAVWEGLIFRCCKN